MLVDTADTRVPLLRGLHGSESSSGSLLGGDYPAIFWSVWLAASADRIFDIGGDLSLKLYPYREYLGLPKWLEWTVYPEGGSGARCRGLAARPDEPGLHFTAEFAPANGADVLLASGGALQRFTHRIAGLRKKPLHVIVNRAPISFGFRGGMEHMGYELCDEWDNGRIATCDYSGMYYRRRQR